SSALGPYSPAPPTVSTAYPTIVTDHPDLVHREKSDAAAQIAPPQRHQGPSPVAPLSAPPKARGGRSGSWPVRVAARPCPRPLARSRAGPSPGPLGDGPGRPRAGALGGGSLGRGWPGAIPAQGRWRSRGKGGGGTQFPPRRFAVASRRDIWIGASPMVSPRAR